MAASAFAPDGPAAPPAGADAALAGLPPLALGVGVGFGPEGLAFWGGWERAIAGEDGAEQGGRRELAGGGEGELLQNWLPQPAQHDPTEGTPSTGHPAAQTELASGPRSFEVTGVLVSS